MFRILLLVAWRHSAPACKSKMPSMTMLGTKTWIAMTWIPDAKERDALNCGSAPWAKVTSMALGSALAPIQKLGAGSVGDKLKRALTGISSEHIDVIKAIFDVPPAPMVHRRPLPGCTYGAAVLPPVPKDGDTSGHGDTRDNVMNEGTESQKKQKTKWQ